MKIAIKIVDLHKSFKNQEILKGVNLEIPAGKTSVIFGKSGSGKSTIIRHIVGLLVADRGDIFVLDKRLDPKDAKNLASIRSNIGFLFQNSALFDSLNVYKNIDFIIKEKLNLNKEKRKKIIEESIELVGLKLDKIAHLMPHELSGGMKKRVALARTICLKPKIILYDEPTSGLDPISSKTITQMIMFLQKSLNVTSVLISHDVKESLFCADFVSLLDNGRMVEHLPKDEFVKSTNPLCKEFIS